jgi:hypothetical protein
MCPARRPWRSIGLLVLVVSMAAAIGATASAQVATLGSPTPEASVPPASPAPDGQSALLAWAACMRENGVEMDDPRFGLDGLLVGGLGKDGAGSKADAESETYQLASETCSDRMTTYKAPPDPGQQAERTEQLLVWSACMREQGIDMPDPNADGSYADYDWKLDLKGGEYIAADEVCGEGSGK